MVRSMGLGCSGSMDRWLWFRSIIYVIVVAKLGSSI